MIKPYCARQAWLNFKISLNSVTVAGHWLSHVYNWIFFSPPWNTHTHSSCMHGWMNVRDCVRMGDAFQHILSVWQGWNDWRPSLPSLCRHTVHTSVTGRPVSPHSCCQVSHHTDRSVRSARSTNYQHSLKARLKALIKLFMLTFSFLRIEDKPVP